jgi:hypothetical protein
MALFRNQKFLKLEELYSKGIEINDEVDSFKLTLTKKTPNPINIIDYDWEVTLSDGFKFYAPMGSESISFPPTRLEWIINVLKESDKYNYSYLANAINDNIDVIYREFK